MALSLETMTRERSETPRKTYHSSVVYICLGTLVAAALIVSASFVMASPDLAAIITIGP